MQANTHTQKIKKPEGMAVKDCDRQFPSGVTSLRDAVTLRSVTLVMAEDNISYLHSGDFNCRGTRAHACRMLRCPLAHTHAMYADPVGCF